MNAPLAPAHSPFGGSVAGRILHCPASVCLVEKVPAHLRKASAYADRGSALHKAVAFLIENECSLAEIAGKTIDSYVVTIDDVENALRPVLAYVDALLDQPGAEYFLERRVVFPTIANTFGTSDLAIRIGSTVHVIDFKFGTGVRVLALYPDGDEDIINAQLLFYAAAARHSLPEFFAGVDHIVLTILQPVSIDPDAEMVSSVEIIPAELDEFIAGLPRAPARKRFHLRRAWSGGRIAAFAQPGRFARLIPVRCSIWRNSRSRAPATLPSKEAYLQLLADGLNLVDAVKAIGKALHDQARAALESGDPIPGYTLSLGRATRHWLDGRATINALIELGLDHDDLFPSSTLRSPKQIERHGQSSRHQNSPRTHHFDALRQLADARRKRTRPDARTGRERAVVFRGTQSFPGGKQTMIKHNSNPDHEPDNDNAVAPAPTGGALAALTALGTVLNAVDTASVVGRSGLPMLTFKRDGSGTWAFGQKRTIVEDGSRWAVNPLTFKRGYICFSNDNKVVGEHLLPVSQPMPEVTELADKAFEWQEQWAVNLKCIDGTDAGTEVIYKPTTVGGIQAVAGAIEEVRDRINGNQHGGKVAPIVRLEKDSYPHPQFGKDLDAAADDRRLDAAEWSGAGACTSVAAAVVSRTTTSAAGRLTPVSA